VQRGELPDRGRRVLHGHALPPGSGEVEARVGGGGPRQVRARVARQLDSSRQPHQLGPRRGLKIRPRQDPDRVVVHDAVEDQRIAASPQLDGVLCTGTAQRDAVDRLKEHHGDRDQSDLLQGTLELLVLKTLSLEPMHGWGISQRIQQMSREVLQVTQGSLYPALQRMKTKGWIVSEWRDDGEQPARAVLQLTAAGRRELAREQAQWERASAAVNRVLGWTGGAA
jgi:PadR family transcriptional regulator, regulatory protein PadR